MDIPTPKNSFFPIRNLQLQGIASNALMAAMDVGIFDVLAQGAMKLDDVAKGTQTLSQRLEAVLEFCVAHGLLEKKGDLYGNSAVADEFLVRSAPLFQGKAMQLNDYFMSMCAEDMSYLLRHERDERKQTDTHWAEEHAMEGTAQEAMAGTMQNAVEIISRLPGFSGFRRMCDIGGNHGTFSMMLVDRNPGLSASICDLPHVMENASARCSRLGYADRIEVLPYDMRTDVLPEASFDLALASHVLYASANYEGGLRRTVSRIADSLRPGGWFVSHHMATDGNSDPKAVSALEVITKLAGYKSHFLPVEMLRDAMTACGLEDIRTEKTSSLGWATLVAGRKSL